MYTKLDANLMVESVDDSLTFYRDILGFSVIASVPNDKGAMQFAILEKDKLNLMLQDRTSLIADYPILDTPKVHPSASLYIMVDNFEQLYSELKAKKRVLYDVHTTFYGAKEFTVADNDGYAITFTEHKEI